MRRSRTRLVSAIVVGALVLPATAGGATKMYKGKMVGDTNSSVTLKAKFRNGKPSKVVGLAYKNLDATCNTDGTTIVPAGELSGDAGKNLNPRIEVGNLFNWFSYPPGRSVELPGRFKQQGKKVVGTIGVFSADPCAAAKGKVKLSR